MSANKKRITAGAADGPIKKKKRYAVRHTNPPDPA